MNDDVSAYAELVDVLANDSDDGQALAVAVTGNMCGIMAQVDDFQLVKLVLTPQQPILADCFLIYQLSDEEGLKDLATIAVSQSADIFSNGLETGDTSRWSEAVQEAGS